jgi:hypothetical protein
MLIVGIRFCLPWTPIPSKQLEARRRGAPPAATVM